MSQTNPYANNPFYNPKGQRSISDIRTGKVNKRYIPEEPEQAVEEAQPSVQVEVGGVNIETQDVKSEEVVKDEPKKRRSRKKRTSKTEQSGDTTDEQAESQGERDE